MFFVLAKVVGFFALPSNLLISLGLLGIVLMATRFARAGRRLAVASVVLIAIVGWSPLGNALILPLEERFPPWDASRGAPIGIISLGGAFDTVVSPARGEIALNGRPSASPRSQNSCGATRKRTSRFRAARDG